LTCLVTLFATGALAATDSGSSQAGSSAATDKAASATTSKPAAKPAAQGAQANPPKAPNGTTATKQTTAKPPKKVDLNNASLEELKTLPTVSEEYAKKIIAHRPYKSKGELVTKAGLPEGVYQAVKNKVEMQTPRKPAPKK
jgi:competence protein ComEA